MKRTLFLLAFVLSTQPLFGTTRYTDDNGALTSTGCTTRIVGTGACTATYAMTQMVGGDTLIFLDGTYDVKFLDTIPSGSMGSPTILQAENYRLAILKPTAVGSGHGTIYMDRKSYITIDGLVVNNTFPSHAGGPAIWADQTTASPVTQFIIVKNTELTTDGIAPNTSCSWGADAILSGNVSFRNTAHDIIVQDNLIHDNGLLTPCTGGGDDGQNHSGGIYLSSYNVTIERNTVYNCARYCIQSNATGANTGWIVRNNLVHNVYPNGQTGIFVNVEQGKYYNNIVYSNSGNAIWGFNGCGTSCETYNNTIYGNAGYCITISSGSHIIKNNICYQNGNGAILVDGGSATCQYNLGVLNGEGPSNNCNSNASSTNPLFTAPGSADFTLQPLSPAIDTGVDLSAIFTKDFNNTNDRVAPWDKGAFEFASGTLPPSNNVRTSRFTFNCAGSAANLTSPDWAQTRTAGAVKVDGSGKCTASTTDAGGGGGASTSVRSSSTGTASSGTAVSLSAPAGTTSGDLTIVALASNGTVTHVDNNGSTPFTNQLSDFQGSGSGTNSIWTRRIVGGDPSTYNFTIGSSQRWTVHAVTLQSPHGSAILDGSIQTGSDGTGTLTTASAPSVTTSFANSIHFIVFSTDGPSNAITSTPAGYTCHQNGGDQTTAICTKVITSPGATGTQSFSWTSISEYQAISFAIRDGGAGASGGDGYWARQISSTYTTKQYAGIKWNNSGSSGTASRIGVGCRISSDTDTLHDGYEATIYTVSGTQHTQLSKVVNATPTEIANITSTSWSSGDQLWLECEGTRLWVFKGATPIIFYNDINTALNTGVPGIVAAGDALGDDFEGGDLNFVSSAGGGFPTIFKSRLIR